jgi:hypothetical protein
MAASRFVGLILCAVCAFATINSDNVHFWGYWSLTIAIVLGWQMLCIAIDFVIITVAVKRERNGK